MKPPTLADDDEVEDDDEAAAFRAVLLLVCNGQRTKVLLPALASALSTIVAQISHDITGIDAFSKLFHDDLRQRWLQAQDIDKVD